MVYWCESKMTHKENSMISSYNQRPVQVTCSHCSCTYDLMVNPEDIIRWQAGEYIQDCMAYLSAAERELLISRTCDNCWKNMFGDDDAEEE